MKTKKQIRKFLSRLGRHAKDKAKLYDGVDKDLSPDLAIIYATEELGEISSALVRKRYQSVIDECYDLAHCVMLIAFSIEKLNLKDR